MKKYLPTIMVLLLAPLALVHAQKTVEFSISPSIGHSFGETEYVMDLTSAFTDENGDIITDEFGNPIIFHLKSQLEYPLDVYMGGVNLRLNPAVDPEKWSLEAGLFTSINDPGEVMKDSDWEGAAGYFPFTQWSYTESSAKMNSILFNAEASVRVLNPGKMSVSLVGGFRYHKIEQELFGVEGWQRLFDDVNLEFEEPFYFDLYENTQVLAYEVKYTMPLAGISSTIELTPNLNAKLKTLLSPVWYKDVDDHILRNKISEADGTGLGFIGSLSARYMVRTYSATTPFIDFFAEYTNIRTSGDQTQTWYGDDPITPDDDTGNSFGGLPHDVNATIYHVGVKVGLTF